MIRLLIVDDHPLFRQGVVDAFSLEPDFQVLAQATTGEDALRLLRQLTPDVAVVDVNLPGINGQQVTRQVMVEKLPSRVVLLTAYDDSQQLLHALKSGAAAYCSKDIEPDRLIEIVRQAALGKYVIGDLVFNEAEMQEWLGHQVEDATRAFSDPGDLALPISAREMEVLICITQGLSNKEIALRLHISHQTVKNHVTAVLRKLGVDDRTQAAIFALRQGWVRLYQKNLRIEE